MAQDVRGAAAPLPWHATEIEETRSALGTDHASGLTTAQVADRLDRFGPNVVPQGGGRSAFQRLIGQFSNPLIVVLLVAGVVTLFMDHPIDAAVIFAVVLINAGVGFIQEGRAEQALAAVRRMMPERAVVIREAERCDILAADLVPGDLVLVEAGDRVPADLRLIRTRSMRTDEAALTGESVPVGKRTLVLPETTALADRTCMAYSGTTVVSGAGRGLVIATGAETELGHISSLVEQTGTTSTPLSSGARATSASSSECGAIEASCRYTRWPDWMQATADSAEQVFIIGEPAASWHTATTPGHGARAARGAARARRCYGTASCPSSSPAW